MSTKSKKRNGSLVFRSRGLVVAGGVLGTLKLLLHQKYIYKTLPNLSDRLGETLRTNSETLCTASAANVKLNNGVAISSIFKLEKDTWIEIVKYPDGSNLMKTLLTMATGNMHPVFLRPVKFLGTVLLHPRKFLRMMLNPDWASNTIIFLVMQTVDNAMRMTLKKGLFKKSLTIKNDGMNRVNAFGYPNMYILDGSAIQGNLGVNSSFTIAALAEYAMGNVLRGQLLSE
ncbi:MAG: hypothetical protein V1733_03215 [bacterium]